MAYLLAGTTIKAPRNLKEENSTQMSQVRTLGGSIRRDYFGSNKRIWVLTYPIIQKANYDTINTIYQTYLSDGAAVTWQVTETNYTIASVNVHVDLKERGFSVGGSDYLSNITLTLTEN